MMVNWEEWETGIDGLRAWRLNGSYHNDGVILYEDELGSLLEQIGDERVVVQLVELDDNYDDVGVTTILGLLLTFLLVAIAIFWVFG